MPFIIPVKTCLFHFLCPYWGHILDFSLLAVAVCTGEAEGFTRLNYVFAKATTKSLLSVLLIPYLSTLSLLYF